MTPEMSHYAVQGGQFGAVVQQVLQGKNTAQPQRQNREERGLLAQPSQISWFTYITYRYRKT